MNQSNQVKEETATRRKKIVNIVSIVICVILAIILILNCTLLIESYVNKDQVPNLGGYMPMIVLSHSMHHGEGDDERFGSKGIETGDLIITRKIDPRKLAVGNVISFFDPDSNSGAVTTHRIVEIVDDGDGSISFRTKGDANNIVDPKLVPEESLVGIYQGMRIPKAGNVAMFMQTTVGLIVCVGIPLILLVGFDILSRSRHDKKNKVDTDALLAELEALRQKQAAMEQTKDAADTNADNSEDGL